MILNIKNIISLFKEFKMSDARAVANYFLDMAEHAGKSLTPMKLQKLIYYAHGWHWGLYDEPLLEEPIQAWKFGPVIPSVYREFKGAGSGPIYDRASRIDWNKFEMIPYEIPKEDKKTIKFLNRIWEQYSPISAAKLSQRTHMPGTPWEITRKGYENDERHLIINDEVIYEYFKDLVKKAKKRANQND